MNRQYTAGGPNGLIDGILGDESWRKGDWQGVQDQDYEAIVTFPEQQSLRTLSLRCLQDTRSWIVMPKEVQFYTSIDGLDYTLVGVVQNDVSPQDYTEQIKDFELNLSTTVPAQYVKVKAINFGTLPNWHQGAGGQAFIFTDELSLSQ
jgi:hypothetical protein